jgi:predicted DCC family thiol-disulfide oxidoreductase YuxK
MHERFTMHQKDKLHFKECCEQNMSENKLVLVYDDDCPVCSNYVQMLRIKESIGELKLVNARDGGKLVDEITAKGINLDKGMVLIMDGRTYYNSDTIHALALISSPSGIANRFNYWIFKSKYRSYFLYPILRFLRGVLLTVLGKKKLNNLEPG